MTEELGGINSPIPAIEKLHRDLRRWQKSNWAISIVMLIAVIAQIFLLIFHS